MLEEKGALINQLIALLLCAYTIDLVALYLFHRDLVFMIKENLVTVSKT